MTFNDTGLIINEEISSVDENGNGKQMYTYAHVLLLKATACTYVRINAHVYVQVFLLDM